MLFALYDYLQYRKRSGRYEKDINKSGSLMGQAFDGNIPEKILSLLNSGDIICIQNFGWWVSWLIMYLTSSSISHVTFYIGNRTITHMTLDGLVKEPIEILYKPESRILPFIWFIHADKRREIETTLNLMKDRVYYDKVLVLKKGLYIVSGRDWSLYRWTFLIDIVLTLIFLELLIFPFIKLPVFSFFIVVYLLILLINRIVWGKKPAIVTYPEQFINWLFRTGKGMPLLDVHLSRLESKQERSDNVED